jgi:cystathionine beta-lyase/cystathionine gamma-synthase
METLACHPRSTTHSEMEPEDLDEAGIGEGLVRISIGIEHWQDLLEDFKQALEP